MFLFAEKKSGRNLSLLLKLSREERDFLHDEAKARGITVLTLLRQCLRSQLINSGKKD